MSLDLATIRRQGLSAADLRTAGACPEQCATLAKAVGGAEVRVALTRANLHRAATLRLDLHWLATRLLTPVARARYLDARAAAWAQYDVARAAALADALARCRAARADARAQYDAAAATAWTQHIAATAAALADTLGLP